MNGYRTAVSFGAYTIVNSFTPSRIGIICSDFVYAARMSAAAAVWARRPDSAAPNRPTTVIAASVTDSRVMVTSQFERIQQRHTEIGEVSHVSGHQRQLVDTSRGGDERVHDGHRSPRSHPGPFVRHRSIHV